MGPHSTSSDVDLDVEQRHLADGTRSTDARAEQIATEAHPETRRRNLIPGGKSLDGDGFPTTVRRLSPMVGVSATGWQARP